MGRIEVPKADREESKKPPLNMWYAPKPWISASTSTSTGIQEDTYSNKVTSLVTPSTSEGTSWTPDNGKKDNPHVYEEDNDHEKKSRLKQKRKRWSKSKDDNTADDVGKLIARIRAFASWRIPRDAREASRQHVLASRAKNKDLLLYRRRCGAVAEIETESHSPAVGETDPTIFNLMWRFQHLKIVEDSSPEPWRLTADRKRVAPSIDRVQHYNSPDIKRRKI